MKRKRKKDWGPTLSEKIEAYNVKMMIAAKTRLDLPRCPQTFMDEEIAQNFCRAVTGHEPYWCFNCKLWHVRKTS